MCTRSAIDRRIGRQRCQAHFGTHESCILLTLLICTSAPLVLMRPHFMLIPQSIGRRSHALALSFLRTLSIALPIALMLTFATAYLTILSNLNGTIITRRRVALKARRVFIKSLHHHGSGRTPSRATATGVSLPPASVGHEAAAA